MQQQQPNPVDLTKTSAIICQECGNQSFKEAMLVRKESRFISGLPDDRIVPVALIVCTKCEAPLDEFIPLPLKGILILEKENKNNV
jgi:hypothetical protein